MSGPYQILTSTLYFRNPKFQPSSNDMSFYRPACVEPGQHTDNMLSHNSVTLSFVSIIKI